MAKFKVGEKARYVGGAYHGCGQSDIGKEVEIISIDAPCPSSNPNKSKIVYLMSQTFYLGETLYGVLWPDGKKGNIPERFLEKPLPKHQKDDLRVADPQFIQHQLPRLLGRKEKVSELEKQ